MVNGLDIHSSRKVVELVDKSTLVADTDNGSVLKREIADLEELLEAYRCGYTWRKRSRKARLSGFGNKRRCYGSRFREDRLASSDKISKMVVYSRFERYELSCTSDRSA